MRASLLLFCSLSAAAQQVITTFAGTDWVFTDEGKTGVNASLAQPVAVATDSKSNLYIVDPFMNSVLKLNTSGVMSIVAGNGLRRSAGDGGPANAALLQNPQGVAVDAGGNIYISESFGSRIRKITPDGLINTIAGPGFGFDGDGGPALQASFRNPTALTVDGAGNLYLRDSNNFRIRKIDTAGKITTVAGTGTGGVSGDGGPAIAAQVTSAGGLLADRQGNLYIAELLQCRVRKIDTAGIITTIAGTGVCNDSGDNASATRAQLNQPAGLVMDAQGFLYISEKIGNRIRRLDPNGTITTTAGVGIDGFSGDGGNSAQAQFSSPVAMAIDSQGNIFVADRDNRRVRRFTYGGNINTVVGKGASIGDGGLAAAARLSFAADIAIDSKGNLYIADSGNQSIRKITTDGVITTVAGNGHEGFAPDGTLATNAQLSSPFSVAIDPQGNVVFPDNGNQRIRRIKSDGTLQTIAGNGNAGIAGDGGFATQANLSNPQYLRYDANGNLYFKNGGNQVRVITTDGRINLIAATARRTLPATAAPPRVLASERSSASAWMVRATFIWVISAPSACAKWTRAAPFQRWRETALRDFREMEARRKMPHSNFRPVSVASLPTRLAMSSSRPARAFGRWHPTGLSRPSRARAGLLMGAMAGWPPRQPSRSSAAWCSTRKTICSRSTIRTAACGRFSLDRFR